MKWLRESEVKCVKSDAGVHLNSGWRRCRLCSRVPHVSGKWLSGFYWTWWIPNVCAGEIQHWLNGLFEGISWYLSTNSRNLSVCCLRISRTVLPISFTLGRDINVDAHCRHQNASRFHRVSPTGEQLFVQQRWCMISFCKDTFNNGLHSLTPV